MKKGKEIKTAQNESRWFSGRLNPESDLIWMLAIPILTFIIYHSVLKFSLVNWDDKRYVEETPIVHGITKDNVVKMFTTKVLMSYNPLVLFSFAVDYELGHLKPEWCHGVNLFFHLLNAMLVYVCMKKMRFKASASGLIALLFAVHPMNVEAVAWIAGRKDVLSFFFFVLAWISYLNFRESSRKPNYILCLFLFLLSLFSKVQAITFPFVILISDYILQGKITKKDILNKIPFVFLSLVFGIIAISGSSFVADKYTLPPTFIEKIIYSIMAFGLYIIKILLPVSLSGIYSFPVKGAFEYYGLLSAGIIIIILITALIIYTIKRAPVIAGGLLIFCVSIFVVLHIVAFNSSLIYERFTYFSCTGIFIAIVHLNSVFPAWRRFRLQLLSGIIILFSTLSYARASIWKNTETMWSDVISKNPDAAEAYNNRGMVYLDRNDLEKAMSDFNHCTALRPNLPDGFNNRSVIFFRQKKYKEALAENDIVRKIDPQFGEGVKNRACYFYSMENYDSAISCYFNLSKLNPDDASSYYFCGACYYNKGLFREAINKYKAAVNIYPAYADAYTYMGICYADLDELDSALICIQQAENAIPNSAARQLISTEFIHAGTKLFEKGNVDGAFNYYLKAAQVFPGNAEAYYNLGGISFTRKDVSRAREYWKKTVEIDPNHAGAKEWLARIGG